MLVEPEGWVEVLTPLPLTEDMFVTHVKGHSMEPQIPEVSLCAFRSEIVGSMDGKVLLIEQYVESGGNRFTVKRCHVGKAVDPDEKADNMWLHERMILESTNPEYKPIDVFPDQKIRVLGEFLFVV
jgi:phage repressor protein C with HTH and peptisase S24 domain